MNAKPFFDTTVLIYAFAENDPRTFVAEELLEKGGVVSVQILNEFVAVSRRKLDKPWTEITEAIAAIRNLCAPPLAITVEVHEEALKISQRYGYQIYDSLVLSAAIQSGCTILYSEDMQDRQAISSLTIQNPFRST